MHTLEELLGRLDSDKIACPLSGKDAIQALRSGLINYQREHLFALGDLMRQKDGLGTAERAGKRGENPMIFIRYLGDHELARYAPADVGAPWPSANTDALAGWLSGDGSFVVSAIHSQAFEPYAEPAA